MEITGDFSWRQKNLHLFESNPACGAKALCDSRDEFNSWHSTPKPNNTDIMKTSLKFLFAGITATALSLPSAIAGEEE